MASRTLSPLQLRRVRQAVRDGHLAFLAEVFGPTAIDREDYDRLRAVGKIRDEKLLPQDAGSAAHALGSVIGDGSHAGRILEAPDEFWRRVGEDIQVVTEAEREAVAVLRARVGEHVRALGARLEEIVGHAVVDADDSARRGRLTKTPPVSGSHVQEVVARIRKATSELRRDWLRVVHTETHNAAEEAKAIALTHRDPGRDPRVFKRPRVDACSFCRLLYLKPDGVTPRVFLLSALIANGSNVGRRAGRPSRSGKERTEWKAVVGAVHPFCGCSLSVLEDGMSFDTRGHLVYVGVAKSTSVEVERLDAALSNHACEE